MIENNKDFNVGDKVVYISECIDHNFNGLLFLNQTYTITEVGYDDVHLKECNWWVRKKHLKLATDWKPPTKLELICKKKEELDLRFKERKQNEQLKHNNW